MTKILRTYEQEGNFRRTYEQILLRNFRRTKCSFVRWGNSPTNEMFVRPLGQLPDERNVRSPVGAPLRRTNISFVRWLDLSNERKFRSSVGEAHRRTKISFVRRMDLPDERKFRSSVGEALRRTEISFVRRSISSANENFVRASRSQVASNFLFVDFRS